jgi:hypothetical protein
MTIQNTFGTVKLKKYPLLHPIKRRIMARMKKLKIVKPLNFINYKKSEVKSLIAEKLGWIDYGGKHYESVFTRFYQGYILPEKFKVDKRKAHLSNLIFSGQISKEEALAELKKPIYPGDLLKKDYDFVLKKLNLSEDDFIQYIQSDKIDHCSFESSLNLFTELKLYYEIF